jgi:tRNA threonylcarbamoyl adenosine modification protein YeaZ
MYLAIDTSTDMASLAVVQDGQVLAELTWHCQRSHTTELLSQLTHLLHDAGADLQSASGVIVARGPGSYNGLRVGISTAKGLALSLGIPIVGIGTLEAAAYQHADTGLPVCPISNAGRGEIAAAMYQKKATGWHQLIGEHLTTVDALWPLITSRTVFCGELADSAVTELRKRLKQMAVIPPPAARVRRASFLAELGLERLRAGQCDDLATLQPLYLRRPPITKSKHRWGMETKDGELATNTN